MQAIVALVFVLCLIGLCAVAARRYIPLFAQGAMPRTVRRLKIEEILPLDPRHRAVLLRCDGRAHLLVVGDGGVTVVQHDVPPAAGVSADAA